MVAYADSVWDKNTLNFVWIQMTNVFGHGENSIRQWVSFMKKACKIDLQFELNMLNCT